MVVKGPCSVGPDCSRTPREAPHPTAGSSSQSSENATWNMASCKGMVTEKNGSTRPCKNWGDRVGADGFCSSHRPRGCVVPTDDGKKCRSKTKRDAHGRCFIHRSYALNPESQCRGKTTEQKRCRREVLEGRQYCSLQHVPRNTLPNPKEFRGDDLRNRFEYDLIKRDGKIDKYTKKTAEVFDRQLVEMDHVMELQMVASAFYLMTRALEFDIPAKVAKWITELVNQDRNLCLTVKETNQAKGAAVKEFLERYNLGLKQASSFKEQLTAQFATMNDNNEIKAKQLARVVMNEMKSAFQILSNDLKEVIEHKLSNKHARSIRKFLDELTRLVIAMGIQKKPKRTSTTSPPSSPIASRTSPTIEPAVKTRARPRLTKPSE